MRIPRIVLVITLVGAASLPVTAQGPRAQWVEHLAFSVVTPPLDNVLLRQAVDTLSDKQVRGVARYADE